MKNDYKNIIHQVYEAFNARNVDKALSFMKQDVHWPNGWEGGYVEGQNAVREYWARQWKEIDPMVQPISVKANEQGEIAVDVHQLAKDLQGNVLFDGVIKHIYTMDKGLIKSMEIEKS
ncbi:MAG: nuclear transport factor 2 family protein [Ginsengibacter sp.]